MEDRNNVIFLLKHIDHQIKAGIDAQLKEQDLTLSQSMVLFRLNQNGGCLSQKELQKLLKVSHPTIVGLVKRLEKSGYVRCETDQNDKRYRLVYLTETAESFMKEQEAQRERNISRATDGLSDEEVAELTRMLNIINENFSNNRKDKQL